VSVAEVRHLSKRYSASSRSSLRYGLRALLDELRVWSPAGRPELRPDEFWAVDDVSFTVQAGEAWGLVGSNGSGKTTLLRLLHGITKPDAGEILLRGRCGGLLGLGTAFDPLQTGRENAFAAAAVHGLTRAQARDRMDAIQEFSGLHELFDTPVHSYSTGMGVRLAFAVATQLDLDLLLVDEALTVGDLAFRRQSIEHVQRFVREGGALVLVDHDLWLMQAMCTNCLVLDEGRVTFAGPTAAALNHYLSAQAPEPAARDAAERRRAGEEVWVESLAFVGPDGGPLVSEAAAELRLEVDNAGPPRDVHWAYAVTTADLMVVITSELCDRPVRLASGATTLTASFEHLPLVPGGFDVRVVVMDAAADDHVLARYGGEAGPNPITVVEGAVDRTIHQIGRVLLPVDVAWGRSA
jgi:ABC-type polysaccharide/polyol phosphate transport system ATPase subunit